MQRNKRVVWLVALATALAMALAGTAVAAEKNYKGFARGDSLVTAEELKAMIDSGDDKLVVIGVVPGGITGAATRKAKGGATGYIPGSLQVWRSDYGAPEGEPYPFGGMLALQADFQKFARELGVDDDSTVVLWDEKYDATRVWWAFFMYGKEDVKILDGGYNAWLQAGYDTNMTSADKPGDGTFTAQPRREGWTWALTDIYRAKDDPTVQLWDTREPDEWSGETTKKGAFRAGRIPWAKFQSWKEFRDKVDGTPTAFKPAAEIQKVIDKFEMNPNNDQVFYCQSGVRTTTQMFALWLMGWDPDRLHNYDGSWIEWSYYDETPVVADK